MRPYHLCTDCATHSMVRAQAEKRLAAEEQKDANRRAMMEKVEEMNRLEQIRYCIFPPFLIDECRSTIGVVVVAALRMSTLLGVKRRGQQQNLERKLLSD